MREVKMPANGLASVQFVNRPPDQCYREKAGGGVEKQGVGVRSEELHGSVFLSPGFAKARNGRGVLAPKTSKPALFAMVVRISAPRIAPTRHFLTILSPG